MEKQHWFESIRYRVPAIVGLTILIPMLAFLFYTYQSARENILENARHSLYTSLYGSSLLMESSMEEVRSFSKDLSRESDLTDKITAYLSEPSERAQKELSLALGQYAGEMRKMCIRDSSTGATSSCWEFPLCLPSTARRDWASRP